MQISIETKQILFQLFKCTFEGESSIEEKRLQLCNFTNFEPYSLFNFIDYDKKKYISQYDLYCFLYELQFSIEEIQLNAFFEEYYAKHLGFTFENFLKIILPKDSSQLRIQTTNRAIYATPPNMEICHTFCELIMQEIILSSLKKQFVTQLQQQYDFSIPNLFGLLAHFINNQFLIDFDSIKQFLNRNAFIASDNEIIYLMERMALKGQEETKFIDIIQFEAFLKNSEYGVVSNEKCIEDQEVSNQVEVSELQIYSAEKQPQQAFLCSNAWPISAVKQNQEGQFCSDIHNLSTQLFQLQFNFVQQRLFTSYKKIFNTNDIKLKQELNDNRQKGSVVKNLESLFQTPAKSKLVTTKQFLKRPQTEIKPLVQKQIENSIEQDQQFKTTLNHYIFNSPISRLRETYQQSERRDIELKQIIQPYQPENKIQLQNITVYEFLKLLKKISALEQILERCKMELINQQDFNLNSCFNFFDKNQIGGFSVYEFSRILKDHCAIDNLSLEQIEQCLKQQIPSGKNKIQFSEFKKFIIPCQIEYKNILQKRFKKQNNTQSQQKLSETTTILLNTFFKEFFECQTEKSNLIQKFTSKLPPNESEKVFNSLDRDQDGEICYDELFGEFKKNEIIVNKYEMSLVFNNFTTINQERIGFLSFKNFLQTK